LGAILLRMLVFRSLLFSVLVTVFGTVGLFLMVLFGSNQIVNRFEPKEPAEYYQATKLKPAPASVDSMQVMDWNIKFGGARIDFFFDCYGDRVHMTEAEVLKNLEGLANKINHENPDVLILQEVDITGARVAGVNQVQWLLDHTQMNYAVYASQWDAYIPKYDLGRVNSGNAILSRWPLDSAVRVALPQMQEKPWLERYFYLRRNLLEARVNAPNKPLWVVATHLEAYCKDSTRFKQLRILEKTVRKHTQRGDVVLFGGDLNTLAPGTKKLKGFDDSVCPDEEFVMDDYTAEREWLSPYYKTYYEAIPLAEYQQDEKRYYSHTVNGKGFWNRRLDYLFSNKPLKNGRIHQGNQPNEMPTMPLSDHAPLTTTLFWAR
jgi:endonuclease/exonuclease/phosphatase family metal-dependent hydrolase